MVTDMTLLWMVALSNHKVYQECRDLTKTIHNKVIKQLADQKKWFRPRVQKPVHKTAAPGDNSPTVRFMDFPKSINQMSHSDPIISTCGTSAYKLQNSSQGSCRNTLAKLLLC